MVPMMISRHATAIVPSVMPAMHPFDNYNNRNIEKREYMSAIYSYFFKPEKASSLQVEGPIFYVVTWRREREYVKGI